MMFSFLRNHEKNFPLREFVLFPALVNFSLFQCHYNVLIIPCDLLEMKTLNFYGPSKSHLSRRRESWVPNRDRVTNLPNSYVKML